MGHEEGVFPPTQSITRPQISPAPPEPHESSRFGEDPPVYFGDSGSLSKRELWCLVRERNREIASLKSTIEKLRAKQ